MFFIVGIQPQCNSFFYHNYKDDNDRYMEQSKKTVEKGFMVVEKLLEKTAGTFCIDNNITLADVCLAPQVHRAIGFGVDVTLFPKIQEIWERLCKIEAFRSTSPYNEPDCPQSKSDS